MLETEYYLVDLPFLLRQKAASVAEDRLIALQTIVVGQGADKDAYERFVQALRNDIETENNDNPTKTDEFDRAAIERLRNKVGRR